MNELDILRKQYDNLEKMYTKDTSELIEKIDKLQTECELWKNRALISEAENKRSNDKVQRLLRHV